uniref:Uncharacterized protein n=1 Tax=Cacopsylla melanoneura TaxID=428564 RepID=A0A8D8SKD6_9HEMI
MKTKQKTNLAKKKKTNRKKRKMVKKLLRNIKYPKEKTEKRLQRHRKKQQYREKILKLQIFDQLMKAMKKVETQVEKRAPRRVKIDVVETETNPSMRVKIARARTKTSIETDTVPVLEINIRAVLEIKVQKTLNIRRGINIRAGTNIHRMKIPATKVPRRINILPVAIKIPRMKIPAIKAPPNIVRTEAKINTENRRVGKAVALRGTK